MKRVAFIVLAPALAAVLLVATGVYRPGSGTASTTREAAAPAPATPTVAPPAGTLVLGGQAGTFAVGLAVRRAGSGELELEAQVLDSSGSGAGGLELEFASPAATAAATPCGTAQYCASLPTPLPTDLDVHIFAPGVHVTAPFALPGSWKPAAELVARATRTYEELESVVYDERVDPGSGKALESRWRVAAPDRFAYRIAGGPDAVVIGSHRWDRERGGAWIESPQDPLTMPEPPWTDAVTNASLLGSETLRGRETWVVSFLDQAGLPTWFTIWIEKATDRTLDVQMTTAAHFMRQHYRSFDQPLSIQPPA